MRRLTLALLTWSMVSSSLAIAANPQNFTLEPAIGEAKFELKENKGKTVVLHFLLKTECPYCLKYTREYALLAATTPDVIHLFIKPDNIDEIKAWSSRLDKTGLTDLPIIYRDPGAKLAKQFGVPDGYKFHGQVVHYPALIALNGDGKELFRYVGKSNGDRMSKADFLKKLEALAK